MQVGHKSRITNQIFSMSHPEQSFWKSFLSELSSEGAAAVHLPFGQQPHVQLSGMSLQRPRPHCCLDLGGSSLLRGCPALYRSPLAAHHCASGCVLGPTVVSTLELSSSQWNSIGRHTWSFFIGLFCSLGTSSRECGAFPPEVLGTDAECTAEQVAQGDGQTFHANGTLRRGGSTCKPGWFFS